MTPLAKAIAKRFLLERGRDVTTLSNGDAARVETVARLLPETQCFEITNALDLISEFAQQHFPHHIDQRLMFWPHAICWFEIGNSDSRVAIVTVAESGPTGPATIYIITSRWVSSSDEALLISAPLTVTPGGGANWTEMDVEAGVLGGYIAAILTAINQPKVIGRQVRHAHRGLERKLNQAGLATRRFSLPDIITLDLEAFVTHEVAGVAGREGHGGRKCYHFVRAHIRPANGQFVKSHWRGDPALGVGRKNYRLVPPRTQ